MKLCSANVLFYGVINFINQILRGVGGAVAKKVCSILQNKSLIKTEYYIVVVSFLILVSAINLKNIYFTVISLIIISFGILMFVLSAIKPEFHKDCIKKISEKLNKGGKRNC